MPDCCNLQRLGAYHDGELAEAEARQVQAHLSECAACSQALVEIERISSVVRTSAGSHIPASTLARLREVPHRNGWNDLLPVAQLLTGVATVLLVVSLSLNLLADKENSGSSPLNQAWEDMTFARDADAELLAEPEVELTRWVVAGLSGGVSQ